MGKYESDSTIVSAERPHILLMTCHDIGRHLGSYGVDTVHTPYLDQLASTGIRFDRAFTVAPSCSPSRAALATGRFPHSNGVMGLAHPPYGWSLSEHERHLAVVLGAAGYETHLFGHQHVSPRPARLGFHHLHGFGGVLGCHEHALGSNVTRRFEEFCGETRTGKPLYMEINLEEPHRPYDQGGAAPDSSKGVSIPPYLQADEASYGEMAALQGAIRQGDGAIGSILEATERAGLNQNLLVIFIADHGLAMPRAKCTLYDPGIEIALLMRWPESGWGMGRVVHEIVSNIDVFPTVLEAIGADVPENTQGSSFLPLLEHRPFTPRTAIFAEKTYHTYYDPMRAIRTERFKYIRNFETTCAVEVPTDVQGGAIFRARPQIYTDVQHPPAELYDLAADPWEEHNLIGNAEYTDVERWLQTWLLNWMMEREDPLRHGWIPSPEALSMAENAGSDATAFSR